MHGWVGGWMEGIGSGEEGEGDREGGGDRISMDM